MIIKRREFFSMSAGALISGYSGKICDAVEVKNNYSVYFSAGSDLENNYFFSGFSVSGNEKFRLSLPSRGHGTAHRPNSGEVAIIARRPGKYILVVDSYNGEKLAQIDSIDGRHFYGHGVYSMDGLWLYATENEYETGDGVIGVYDVRDGYKLVETIQTYGIGPHEIVFLGDGKTMVVANGGIMTHPESGRHKLNLAEMDSSLVYIEINSGKLLSKHKLTPELKLMSIRHLDVGLEDNIALVMQYQGPRRHLLPLVGFQKGSSAIEMLQAPQMVVSRMKNYCGSVAFDMSGKLVAVSSPRGGIITFWSVSEKRFLTYLEAKDGCGVAPENTPGCFRISNGLGQIIRYSPLIQKTEILVSAKKTRWDNHLLFAGS
jgi:hypothetical protein